MTLFLIGPAMSLAPSAELLDQYGRLTRGEGFVELGSGSTVTLTGVDRQKFLNGFCTNDVVDLMPGTGCEAFLTSVQGKTLGHVLVTCREDALVLITVPNQAATLVAHLDHYHIREQVEIRDTTAERTFVWVGGLESSVSLKRLFESLDLRDRLVDVSAGRPIQVIEGRMGDLGYYVIAGDLLGDVPSFLVEHTPQDALAVRNVLQGSGLAACDAAALDLLRLEAGLPLFGVDFDDANLPQEIGRNQRALSLTKGCYLGQETVARIDALGHVNRTLVGVTFPADFDVAAGTELRRSGAAVGRVTSVGFSPKLGAGIALAMVRRGNDSLGIHLESPSGAVEVIALPVAGRR